MRYQNLIAGKITRVGLERIHMSPMGKQIIGKLKLLPKNYIKKSFQQLRHDSRIDKQILFDQFKELSEYIKSRRDIFTRQIILETGYTLKDSKDIVKGVVELLAFFKTHINLITSKSVVHPFSLENKTILRTITIKKNPYGIIAVICPKNAPLILELTALLNAFISGNCVVIKASTQTSGSVSLLIEGIINTFSKESLEKLSVITCEAPQFLKVAFKYANLIHFIGGSQFAEEIIRQGFKHNKKVLIDGEGGSYVVVDKNINIDKAVKICKSGIIRCNGELCTSIKGIIVNKIIYKNFYAQLKKEIEKTVVGNPFLKDSEVGPLFSYKQIKQANTAFNINIPTKEINYAQPQIILINKKIHHALTSVLTYGPFVWITSYSGNEWKSFLNKISYSLTDTLISENKNLQKEFITASRAPRVVINADPSCESVFEPWGAYLPSGHNNVSYWFDKYQRNLQIDIQSNG